MSALAQMQIDQAYNLAAEARKAERKHGQAQRRSSRDGDSRTQV